MLDIGLRKKEFFFLASMNYVGFIFIPMLSVSLLKLNPNYESFLNIVSYIVPIVLSINTTIFILMYFRRDSWKFKDEPLIKCSDCRRDLGM